MENLSTDGFARVSIISHSMQCNDTDNGMRKKSIFVNKSETRC